MKTTKTPSALDFAKMFGEVDYSVLPPQKVAKMLRIIADLMDSKQAPLLNLMEAHSMENVAAEENASITLVLRFRRLTPMGSPEQQRKVDKLTRAQMRELPEWMTGLVMKRKMSRRKV